MAALAATGISSRLRNASTTIAFGASGMLSVIDWVPASRRSRPLIGVISYDLFPNTPLVIASVYLTLLLPLLTCRCCPTAPGSAAQGGFPPQARAARRRRRRRKERYVLTLCCHSAILSESEFTQHGW